MIAAGVVGAFGLAALVLAAQRGVRIAALAVATAEGAVLAVLLRPEGNDLLLAVGAVAGAAVAVGLAVLFLRWPWLLPMAALACAPARVPVHVGGEEASLLLPLYGVVAGGSMALAWQLLRGDTRTRELGPLSWPLAAFIAWSGMSLVWSDGPRVGAVTLVAFYLPFGLLALFLARLPWKRRWLTALGVQLVVMALAFAAIGVFQWTTRDVFWNPKVINSNAYAPFFRVNSIFWDPSIYGRFLAVAILVALVVALYGVRRNALASALAIVGLWVGLVFSFSQSSFVALIVGVVGAVVLAWPPRAVAALAGAALVLLAAGFVVPSVRAEILDNTDRATGQRSKLVTEGLQITADHPLGGVGLGGFKRAYGKRVGFKAADPKRAASHNTPVTVAAETGVPGFALFAWLVGAALWLPFRRASHSFAGRASLSCGLALGAILVHSLFYDAFFEDPLSWGLLGLIALGYAWRTSARASRALSAGK
ncbi:MAG TPA: O-antigen ligase family protein [Gaiellaceae bacterium]|nr:O-antigen ligase family protein [Gaiellaceae bacterium]